MKSTSFRSAALARRAAPQLLALTPAALRTPSRLPAASLARSASSFIARAKESGPEGLLGDFTSAGTFDRCLEEAELACTSVADGRVECAFTVTHETANNFGTLHGGFTATLVDVVGTMALLSRDAGRPGVSIEMSQTFCAAAKVGERVTVVGTVLKAGGRLGFTQVEVRRADDAVVAVGRHTKMFV